jgi:hypothetical protein
MAFHRQCLPMPAHLRLLLLLRLLGLLGLWYLLIPK